MVSPHYPQATKSCPAKDRDIPEFSGRRINLLVPKDMCLFNREGSTQIWTVSELTKHESHCLCFAGSAKPLTLNWNATRTIYSNWCFLESSLNRLNKFNESSACGLGLPQRNFKHSDGIIPKMPSEFGPHCDRKIHNVIKSKQQKKYNSYKNIFIKAEIIFFYA